VSLSADDLLRRSRQRIRRVQPEDLGAVSASGGIVVDIRPAHQRADEGELPGAVVVERNVLEWRLEPGSPHSLGEVTDRTQQVVIVCSEGYASSLAAASLADLGFENPCDLEGGYRAWTEWRQTDGAAG
jgi:rhodanese-related sulfurtransferase